MQFCKTPNAKQHTNGFKIIFMQENAILVVFELDYRLVEQTIITTQTNHKY